jgi:hypothetical protein
MNSKVFVMTLSILKLHDSDFLRPCASVHVSRSMVYSLPLIPDNGFA